MQAKISVGNDYLRFPQVTGGILLCPQVIHMKSLLFASGRILLNLGMFFLSSTKQFGQYNHLLSLRSKVNPSIRILFQKKLDCSLLALQSVIQKKQFNKKFFTLAKMIGNCLLSTFHFSHSSRVTEFCQATVRFGHECHLNHSAF